MFGDRRLFAVPLFLAALLGAAAGLAEEQDAAAEKEVPWHVQDAEVRVPLSVSLEEAARRMPPDVYLADLKPVRTKGLSFDPKTKAAVKRDRRSAEQKAKMIADIKAKCKKTGQKFSPKFYRPAMRAFGSATFRLKPEYKWLSLNAHLNRGDNVSVFIDGEKREVHGGRGTRTLALPPGAKTLRIEAVAHSLTEAGFTSRHPAAAEATFCLPGRDPTTLIPVVYDLRGNRVGSRVLWAHPTEPMRIVFDASSGQEQYMAYLVPRAKNPKRLDWAPRAGLILEGRYPDRYDPALKTVEGFMKLWDQSDFIAGKLPQGSIMRKVFPFRPMGPDAPNYRVPGRGIGQGPGEPPLALARYTGFFHVPQTQEYKFLFKVQPGGYLLFDDQLVSKFPDEEAEGEVKRIKGLKPFKLKLEQGLHKIDVCQYGSGGRFDARLIWYNPGNPKDSVVFGGGFRTWEPLVPASAGTVSHREQKPFASFTWRGHGTWMPRGYPAGDIIHYSFAGKLWPEREDAVFRWRFDDGHTAEGRKITHRFFAPGMRKVELEVLDGPDGKVVARAAGNVHAHVRYDWAAGSRHDGNLWNPMVARRKEYATVTPIREVVSLYYWMLQTNWVQQRVVIGDALSGRIDEVIAAYPHPRLLEMARYMTEPVEAHHDAAEKLLEAVMDRAPVGGHPRKSAAASLADIRVSVRDEPEKGLQLLEKAEKAEPTVDMDQGWRTAEAKQWYWDAPEAGDLAAATKDLDWSDASYLSFTTEAEGGRGTWVAKDFQIPASRKGKTFLVDLGQVPYNAMIWFNGKLLGTRWDAPEGPVVVSPEMQRYGAENRFLALFQPPSYPGLPGGRAKLQGFSGPGGRGFRLAPIDLYTSPSCEEKGVQYTCYEGDWPSHRKEHGTFPDLDTMKPIKNGTLTDLAFTELRVGSLGHHMPRVGTESRINVPAEGIEPPFTLKLFGYFRVRPGVYTFRLRDVGKVFVDSRPVTLRGGRVRVARALTSGSAAYLREGVHFLEVVYFCGRENQTVHLFVPDTVVPTTEASPELVKVDALVAMGEEDKAREILLELKPDAWPISELTQLKLSSALRRVSRGAEKGGLGDVIHGLAALEGWLRRHPMLRMEPEVVIAKVEVLAGIGDYDRAFTLARQTRRMDMNQSQREQLMLVQVRAMLGAGRMDAAREVYQELKETAPYSTATVEAREAITEAALRQ